MPDKPKTNYSIDTGMEGKDLFQTPAHATKLLLPFIPNHIKVIWECAAGDHKMVSVLADKYDVFPSDIRLPEKNNIIDFLTDPIHDDLILDWNATMIITNPPFSIKKQFFDKCIQYNIPFALLIPADYSLWVINAIRRYGCEKIIPDHRINYITPNNRKSAAQFHSMFISRFLNLGKTETFVELTKDMMRDV